MSNPNETHLDNYRSNLNSHLQQVDRHLANANSGEIGISITLAREELDRATEYAESLPAEVQTGIQAATLLSERRNKLEELSTPSQHYHPRLSMGAL